MAIILIQTNTTGAAPVGLLIFVAGIIWVFSMLSPSGRYLRAISNDRKRKTYANAQQRNIPFNTTFATPKKKEKEKVFVAQHLQ